jgi:hypothetical protein
VGADHLRGYDLCEIGNRTAGINGKLRADYYGCVLLLLGHEDAYAAPTSLGVGWM